MARSYNELTALVEALQGAEQALEREYAREWVLADALSEEIQGIEGEQYALISQISKLERERAELNAMWDARMVQAAEGKARRDALMDAGETLRERRKAAEQEREQAPLSPEEVALLNVARDL